MIFTDLNGRLIGDAYVNLTGVDGHGDENEPPLKIENKNDLDYQDDQGEVHTDQEVQANIQQPVKVELQPLE